MPPVISVAAVAASVSVSLYHCHSTLEISPSSSLTDAANELPTWGSLCVSLAVPGSLVSTTSISHSHRVVHVDFIIGHRRPGSTWPSTTTEYELFVSYVDRSSGLPS